MTKKIVHQERIGNRFWAGEYHKWECGCSEIIFWIMDHHSVENYVVIIMKKLTS